MSAFLYPRLDAHSAVVLLGEQIATAPHQLRSLSAVAHSDAACAPTGGNPVSEHHLLKLQATLQGVCDDFGFPKPLKKSKQGEFDRVCGTILHRDMGIVPADAAEEGVWSFVSLVVVPELAPWRFPDRHQDRLLGKRRNALRRLWWRAHVLGPDLTSAPPGCSPFGEDEFVQVMERPTIARNFRLAKHLQGAMWRLELEGFPGNRAEVLRSSIKIIRADRSHIAMDVMSDAVLDRYLDEIVREAITWPSSKTNQGLANAQSLV